MYSSFQDSLNTVNESFVLGSAGGDHLNSNSGNFAGLLVAGHQYEWVYQFLTQSLTLEGDGGATAAGFMNLKIGDGISPVLEPKSFAIWCSGALACLVIARRRKRRMVLPDIQSN